MNYELLYILVILAVLSVTQRVLPWLLYSKFKKGESFERAFDLFAISAFSALLVYNVQEFNAITVIALAVALLVVLKTKNLGLTVLVALAIFSLSML